MAKRMGAQARQRSGEADLLNVLGAAIDQLDRNAICGARIYVAASEGARTRLETIFAPTVAELMLLDPAKPIPQRPEMMPRADGSLPYRRDFRKD